MKRSWFGFLLLVALLLGSLLVTKRMTDIHDPLESKLLQSAQCAVEGDWHQARELFQQAEALWRRDARLRSCFADHNPVEAIDASFAMLETVCAAGDPVSFAGGCRSLARQVAAVGESHELKWWNLL